MTHPLEAENQTPAQPAEDARQPAAPALPEAPAQPEPEQEEIAQPDGQPETPARLSAEVPPPARRRLKGQWIALAVLLVLILAAAGVVLGIRQIESSDLSAGQASLAAGDWPAAEAAFDHALGLQSSGLLQNIPQLTLGRAQARFQQAKYGPASKDLDSLIAAGFDQALPYQLRARIYFQAGDYAQALPDLNQSITRDPGPALPYLLRGQIYYQQASYDLALADLAAYTSREPQPALPYLLRTKIYLEQAKLEAALPEAILAQERDDTLGLPYALQAQQAYRQYKFPEALAAANAALQRDEKLWQAYLVRGLILAWKSDYDPALADLGRALELKPGESEALAMRTRIYLALEKPDLAAADAAAADPKTPAGLWAQSLAAYFSYEDEKAISLVSQAIQLAPERAEFYAWRAIFNDQNSDYKSILADYDKALSLYPDLADAILGRLNLLDYFYQPADIMAEANKILSSGHNIQAYYLLSDWYLNKNINTQALEQLGMVNAHFPGVSMAYTRRASIYLSENEIEKARAELQKAQALNTGRMYTLRIEARLAAQEKKYDQALTILDAVIQKYPAHQDLYTERAWVNIDQKKYDPARADVEQALKLDPANIWALQTRSELNLASGDTLQALADANRLVELVPGSPMGFIYRAKAYLVEKKPELAQKEAQTAQALEPDNFSANSIIADALMSQDKPDQAIPWAVKAAELDPKNAWPWLLLGNAYFQTEAYADSVKSFKQALLLDPSQAATNYWLAISQWYAGDEEDAKKSMAAALDAKNSLDVNLVDAGEKLLSAWKKLPPSVGGKRTYEDANLGFAITYPNSWNMETSTTSSIALLLSAGVLPDGASLGVLITKNLAKGYTSAAFADELKGLMASNGYKFVSRAPFQMDGINGAADLYTKSGKDSKGNPVSITQKIYVVVRSDGRYAAITLAANSTNFNTYESAGDQIAATFKFK